MCFRIIHVDTQTGNLLIFTHVYIYSLNKPQIISLLLLSGHLDPHDLSFYYCKQRSYKHFYTPLQGPKPFSRTCTDKLVILANLLGGKS